MLATACKLIATAKNAYAVEGIVNTEAVILLKSEKAPTHVTLGGEEIKAEFSAAEKLVWLKFQNQPRPRELKLSF